MVGFSNKQAYDKAKKEAMEKPLKPYRDITVKLCNQSAVIGKIELVSSAVTYTSKEVVTQLGISKQVLYFYRLNKVIVKGIDYSKNKTISYNSSAISKIKEYREGNRIYKKSGTICNKRKSN
jgi:hypothetical protein